MQGEREVRNFDGPVTKWGQAQLCKNSGLEKRRQHTRTTGRCPLSSIFAHGRSLPGAAAGGNPGDGLQADEPSLLD